MKIELGGGWLRFITCLYGISVCMVNECLSTWRYTTVQYCTYNEKGPAVIDVGGGEMIVGDDDIPRDVNASGHAMLEGISPGEHLFSLCWEQPPQSSHLPRP